MHRDVKPSNVLLDQTGHVYLADFGLTRRLDDQLQACPATSARSGRPRTSLPSSSWASPSTAAPTSTRLAACFTSASPERPVFPRESRLALAWAHLEEEPPRASRRRIELPEAIDSVISRAMAKEPEERYPTCAALISAAEETLGFRKAGSLGRTKPLFIAAAVLVVLFAAAAIAAILLTGHPDRPVKAPTRLFAPANTLARIDPATDKVVDVFHVGVDPVVTAAGDYTVWVYSRAGGSISRDQCRDEQGHRHDASAAPGRVLRPVHGASAGGGRVRCLVRRRRDGRQQSRAGSRGGRPAGKREYPLRVTPTGVAVSGGAVWVVGHDPHEDEVLRVDPAGGRVTVEVRLPTSARIDSIAYGYGAVWVVSSATATLYRIDPRSTRVTSLVVAHSRATRPEILPRGGDLWSVQPTGRPTRSSRRRWLPTTRRTTAHRDGGNTSGISGHFGGTTGRQAPSTVRSWETGQFCGSK